MKKIGMILILIIGVLGGWYLVKGSKPMTVKKELVAVPVRLKWLHQAQFAGIYVADQKGYYAEKGIKVDLKPFDYVNFPIEEIVSGKAKFAVAGADELLLARAEGKPVKAVAVIYQENPVVAYTLESSGINEPKDFVGKKIGIEKGVNVEYVIRAMLKDQGIDYKKVKEVPIGFEVGPLLKGEVDIATGYVTNEPIQVVEAGKKVTVISPAKYGVNLYADVLVTTEETIKNEPELVRNFVAATLQGWEYALEHQIEAVQMTLKYEDKNNTQLNEGHQKALLEKSIPLIKPSKGTKIGEMYFVKWKETYDFLRNNGIINQEIDVSLAYDSSFLK